MGKKIIMEYILLEAYNATYNDFSILIPETMGIPYKNKLLLLQNQ